MGDPRKPRSLAPTSSPCSARSRSRSSRRLSASSTLTRTASSLLPTSRLPSQLSADQSVTERQLTWWVKLPDPSTSHRWSHSSLRRSGGTDDDDVIIRSFEAFEINGQIDAEMFRHSLMTWGEKFSANEIDDAFREFKIDGGMIDAEHLKGLMVTKKEEE